MHVDGFRFDLAATLARQFHEVDRLSAFFDLIQQDPVVSQVKLIAEPWDVGDGGYQVGNFPPVWSEWNGKYRDTVRDFWRGEPATLPELASRLTGSSDLYQADARRPVASINFVTAHDGFTLADLVSYNEKHNEANGEGNNDGESHNRSWNCGVEGPTDDAEVVACLRAAQQRNFLATLLLSQGVPMLLGRRRDRPHAGRATTTPTARTTRSPWFDWEHDRRRSPRVHPRLIALRRDHPVFRRRRLVPGAPDPRHGRHRLVPARRHGDGRRRLGRGLRPVGRVVPQRRHDRGPRPAGQPRRRRLVPPHLQRPRRAPRLDASGAVGWRLALVIDTADDAAGRS